MLKAVKRLLHEDGLTIRGVQRLHKEQGLRKLVGAETADLISDVSDEQISVVADTMRYETSGLQRLLADLEQGESASGRRSHPVGG